MDNQTDPDDLLNVSESDLGTGIFLIPDVLSDSYGAMNKVFVSDINYSECVSRGQFAFAFKWVPHSVEAEPSLRMANCSVHLCVKTCKIRGCTCNTARGRCQ